MSYEDFCHYFSGVTICMVEDNYHYEALHKNQKPGDFSVFRASLATGGNTFFMVTHADSRRFGGDDNYEYSPVRVIVAKQTKDKLQRVEGLASAFQRDTFINLDLEAGDYLIYVQVCWTTDETDQFGFSVYSESSIKLSDTTFKETNFLDKVFNIELAKTFGNKRTIGPNIDFYEVQLDGENPETGKFYEGVYFDLISNASRDSILDIEVLHKSFENVELQGQFNGQDSYKLTLKPGESKGCVKLKIDLTDSVDAPISIRKTLRPARN